jgi:hypothetical protein
MSQLKINRVTDTETEDHEWKSLYWLGRLEEKTLLDSLVLM